MTPPIGHDLSIGLVVREEYRAISHAHRAGPSVLEA